MKLIRYKTKDGEDMYINPHYVESIKGVYSEYNNDWCIVLNLDINHNNIVVLPFKDEDSYKMKMNEIVYCMESINE